MIILVIEAEVAALVTVKDSTPSCSLQKGDRIITCNCGTTTTEVSGYLIRGTSPSLQLEQCIDPIGLRASALSLVRNFTA